jgi:hypothetical protein
VRDILDDILELFFMGSLPISEKSEKMILKSEIPNSAKISEALLNNFCFNDSDMKNTLMDD